LVLDSRDKKKEGRVARGQISNEDLIFYLEFSSNKLILMLEDDNPQKRTAAARILGDRKELNGILPLCDGISSEKYLYPRIAMSEALGKMGEHAVVPLLNLLGKIGNNQEVQMPSSYFKKKSFPLPRDMAARTLVKIGTPATPHLIRLLKSCEEYDDFVIEQTIDAIGGIAAKTGDKRAVDVLINMMRQFQNNSIVLWKSVRALSSFKANQNASKTLVNLLKYNCNAPIIWEAIRSLGKIGIKDLVVIETLRNFKDDSNPEIMTALRVAMDDLGIDQDFY
jgi:HEAT repeat protein